MRSALPQPTPATRARFAPKKRRRWLRTLFVCLAAIVLAFYLVVIANLIAFRWINPVTTSVQAQRRVAAFFSHTPYTKHYKFVPLASIAPALRHAVIAAEDGRFFEHHGFDWKQVQKVVEQDVEKGKVGRGASTIDQQLVKNLFLTTSRSFIRKGVEFTLVPVMEAVLSKERILELYLNVIEWGPGVYGAEAAAQYWYHVPASQLRRDQSTRLAAIIPAPTRRRPSQMTQYSQEIDHRMHQMGW